MYLDNSQFQNLITSITEKGPMLFLLAGECTETNTPLLFGSLIVN